jgi:hypothetical protein
MFFIKYRISYIPIRTFDFFPLALPNIKRAHKRLFQYYLYYLYYLLFSSPHSHLFFHSSPLPYLINFFLFSSIFPTSLTSFLQPSNSYDIFLSISLLCSLQCTAQSSSTHRESVCMRERE